MKRHKGSENPWLHSHNKTYSITGIVDMGGSNVPERNKSEKTEQERKVKGKEAHLINRSNIYSQTSF